ncbi:hypothetical protein ACN47E_009671 [Coniothyrium glycines]
MSHTAFFYGTLLAPPILHRVLWNAPTPPTPAHASLLHSRPALLPGFQRRRVRAADYPAVVPSSRAGDAVRGVLVTGLTDGDVWRLDVFEGGEYVRRRVGVRVLREGGGGGEGEGEKDEGGEEEEGEEEEEVEAETYVWSAGVHRLEDEEWDFAEFVREKLGRWVGGADEGAEEADDGFQDVQNAVAALQQDPTGGRGANGDISRQLQTDDKAKEDILQSAV